MMKKLLRLFPYVRNLERTAQQHADYVAGKVTLEHIAIENGTLTAALGTDLARYMAQCFCKTLKEAGADNYVEMQFTNAPVKDGDKPGPRICVTVRYAEGHTPHELREQAEERLAWAARKISGQAWREAGVTYGQVSDIPAIIGKEMITNP